MRYLTVGMAIGLMVMAPWCRAEELSFEPVEPVARQTVMAVTGVSRKALRKALDVHQLMYDIRGLERETDAVANTMKLRQAHDAQKEAVEKCSISKLEGHFQDPAGVWEKMKAEYDKRIQDLTIYFNSAEPATEEERKEFEARMAKGEMSPEMVSESFAAWQVARDVLMDVYQNQDAWGARPETEGSTTFPLWADQKYQLDKDWDDFYTKMNLAFGVPPQGRPVIGDEKYDYKEAEAVQKAHEAYLALLVAQSPVKGAALAAAFQNPPMAPRPLPPKNEITVYLNADSPEAQVFPEMPAPWSRYAEEQFGDINPTGEMAEDFVSGLTLKPEAARQNHGNRLEAYQTYKEQADSSARLESLSLEQADRRISGIKMRLSRLLGLDLFSLDLVDPDVREAVLTNLKEMKRQYLDLADEEIKGQSREEAIENRLNIKWEEFEDFEKLRDLNPAAFDKLKQEVPPSVADRDKDLLKALRTDMEARVYLNEANAGEVDKMMKEEQARRAFLAEDHAMEDMLAAIASVKIDDSCINGGI